jgi:2-polyprenyl-6-methoxyphenol hydroxylase-like FAD-dependent oxidoreductase
MGNFKITEEFIMAQSDRFVGRQAVVIGASMAGLLAARVLAEHFEQVTLLERDTFPEAGENRKGVPQGKHAHGLLARGLQIMENYFPGLTGHLVSLGADHGDVSQKVFWFFEGGRHRPTECGIDGIVVSRPLLEATIRQRVLALANVRTVEGCDVLGLLSTADQARVTGVRLIRRQVGSAAENLAADLVVDASGRGSRGPAWLESLGYERPAEEAVKMGLTYTSCHYRRRPEHAPGVNVLFVDASLENRRMAALLGQEGNRWILTVAGYLGDHAPADHAGLLAYTRSLDSPAIYEIVKAAEPLHEPVMYKMPSNLRRRYERLCRFPEGYLVMGDALCSFNPIYTQGMSVAAMESAALDACLRRGEKGLARRFFKEASRIVDVAWSLAVDSDLRFPEIEGPRGLMARFGNWYLVKLHRAAHHDAAVSVAFLKVVNLLEPPHSLVQPGIVWRVLRENLRARTPGAATRFHPAAGVEADPESVAGGGHLF